MPDLPEETVVVFDPATGIETRDFVDWWNAQRECRETAIAVLLENPRPVSLGAPTLIQHMVELLPEAKAAATFLLGGAATAYLKGRVDAYLQAKAEQQAAKNEKKAQEDAKAKASQEWQTTFVTVTQEDEKRRRTFFVR